jgi:hypothetical protein
MYVGLTIKLFAKDKIKIANDPVTKKPRSMWTWGIAVNAETKALIMQRRRDMTDRMLGSTRRSSRDLAAKSEAGKEESAS